MSLASLLSFLSLLPASRVAPRPWAFPPRVRADQSAQQNRPNGPGEPSPGLRPKADALGRRGTTIKEACKAARALRLGFVQPEALATFQAAWGKLACLPRASAFGLSPGLGSLGPLGRFVRCSSCRTGAEQNSGGSRISWHPDPLPQTPRPRRAYEDRARKALKDPKDRKAPISALLRVLESLASLLSFMSLLQFLAHPRRVSPIALGFCPNCRGVSRSPDAAAPKPARFAPTGWAFPLTEAAFPRDQEPAAPIGRASAPTRSASPPIAGKDAPIAATPALPGRAVHAATRMASRASAPWPNGLAGTRGKTAASSRGPRPILSPKRTSRPPFGPYTSKARARLSRAGTIPPRRRGAQSPEPLGGPRFREEAR
jgi:hypothetical protein